MARAIWNGSISFGLVTIPVKLYNAVNRKSVSFNQLDDRTMSRIKYKKVSAADGSEVPSEHMVRAYEYAKGQYVLVSDEEIQSVAPKAGRSVDIEAFVDMNQIDPMSFDGAYYVAPHSGFEKAYRLLAEAMDAEGKVAIARFVRSNKQYLAAIRPSNGHMELATLVYADELVPAESIPEFEHVADIEVTAAELAMAKQLIGSLEADFAPENYRDTHRDDLVALLNRKAAGEEIVMSVPEVDDGKVVDLLAALEASVAAAKAARAGGEPSATPAKKRAANKAAPAKTAPVKTAAKTAPVKTAVKTAPAKTVAKKAPAKKAVAKRRSA